MSSFNKVVLLGNLTRDPEARHTPSQTMICKFGMATSRKWKDASGQRREETCFVDCTAFGKVGEIVNQYVHKGSPLLVEGRLKYDTWEDKNGGGKRSKLSVAVENVRLMGERRQDSPPPQQTTVFKDDDVSF